MLLDIKCLALILYSTIPRWMRKLPSLCVREAKCLGLESKPAHGLTESGNTEQKEMNELLPFPVLVKWSCRFQGIILCSLCSELSWNPCSYKHLILVLGGKNPTQSKDVLSLPVFYIIVQWLEHSFWRKGCSQSSHQHEGILLTPSIILKSITRAADYDELLPITFVNSQSVRKHHLNTPWV